MQLIARPLPGMLVLEAELRVDDRGFFARYFCRTELGALGLAPDVEQANLSLSAEVGTLRGLHYQVGPNAETKVLTCLQGGVHDVVLDLRPTSPTFGRYAAVDLTPENRRIVVVPEGCAHGFLTLTKNALVFYLVSRPYDPARERGVRWNDPAFKIAWPFAPCVISDRDANHPDFDLGLHRAA